jgi:phosphoribosyl-ATP pyrophosphohydrolase
MATPRRIFRIYQALGAHAAEISAFLGAKGEEIPGTVQRLVARDRAKLLARWGEEMDELCGVLGGTHHDPYILEATQTFYWACLFAVVGNATWDDLAFDQGRRLAVTCGIGTVPELHAATARIVALEPDRVKPAKLVLLWHVADHIYRQQTPLDKQRSLEEIMEVDFQEMRKRAYLEPILREVVE